MADYDHFHHGGVEYPLTSATTNPLLADADPALNAAINYLAAILRVYIGPRLLAEARLANLKLPDAVVQTKHVEPAPFLLAADFQFPTLAIYRKSEEYSDKTLSYWQDAAIWEIAYLLPPLTPVQVDRLNPILRSAAIALRQATAKGGDANYQSGARIWKNAGIEKAMLTTVKYGGYEPIQQIPNYYRAIVGTMLVTEREMPDTTGMTPFAGSDMTLDERKQDGTSLTIVTASTWQPPTISGVAPTTGAVAGGTSVTITGTGFMGPATVRFQDVTVQGVVISSTQISAVSPPHAALVADITVTNGDGQTATLSAAFTFA